ncbi:hypothetical protein EDC01DRAFT_682450 [Geopyxis carbonaria]|nr:hypothetical protein EDC01DRAFT_682450 [Geopyxis carbonaria]
MKFSPLLLAAALPLLVAGQETQLEYDQESTSFSQSGLCRAYHSTDRSLLTKGLSTCQTMCGDLVKKAADEGKTNSLTCVSGGVGIPLISDPDGNQYTMGACTCDVPILDELVEDVLLALPAIAEIGCEILFNSFDLVLKIGLLALPGPGEAMDVGMQAGLKAAKTLLQNGKRASSFAQWFWNPCGDSKYTEMVDDLFNPLSSVSDEVMEGNGCPGECPPAESVSAAAVETPEATSAPEPEPTASEPAPEPTTTDAPEPEPTPSEPAPPASDTAAPPPPASSVTAPLPPMSTSTAPANATLGGYGNSTTNGTVPAVRRRRRQVSFY